MEHTKKKRNIILVIVIVLILLMAAGAYHYFFIYRAPEAITTRELQETNEAYDFLIEEAKSEAVACEHVVLINPSHGGSDVGAKITVNGRDICESDIVLAIAQYVKELNTDESVAVILTRNSDTNPTYEQRASFAEVINPDLIIDIHVAMEDNPDTTGVLSYYSSDYYDYRYTNEEWADCLERNVVTQEKGVALGLVDLVNIEGNTELDYIKGWKVPAVALSCGYLSSDIEGKYLSNREYQQTVAYGILSAIEEAIGE